jgi:hypothetical protein
MVGGIALFWCVLPLEPTDHFSDVRQSFGYSLHVRATLGIVIRPEAYRVALEDHKRLSAGCAARPRDGRECFYTGVLEGVFCLLALN